MFQLVVMKALIKQTTALQEYARGAIMVRIRIPEALDSRALTLGCKPPSWVGRGAHI